MNKSITNIKYHFLLACLFVMGTVTAFAQDNTSSESHTTTSQSSSSTAPAVSTADWMNNPWVWIGGGIVVLLLLYAIFSGKSKDNSRSEVKRTTTVTTEVKND